MYKVHYRYWRTGAGPVEDYSLIIAKNAAEAEEAFKAVHPAGSNFGYEIVRVEVAHPYQIRTG